MTWRRLAKILARLRSAKTGRPAYPPLVLPEVLLLQSWHNLSDAASGGRLLSG